MLKVYPSKWLRVFLPAVLIVVWIGVSGVGGPYFGKIEEVSEVDLTAFLPESADSTEVADKLGNFISDDTLAAITVFESSDNQQLSDPQLDEIAAASRDLAKIDGVEGQVSPPIVSKDKEAAFVALQASTDVGLQEVVGDARDELNTADLQSINTFVTGPAGFAADLNVAFSGIDGILLLTALSVVFVILIVVYRSALLPIIVLSTSIAALSASILIVFTLAKLDVIELNGQVQGILFILVIGAATDYSLLYVSRYREALYANSHRWQATIEAYKGALEPILASGGTVIVGLLCLLLSDLASNKALGPVGSIGIAMAMLAALTLLPSALLLTGRKAFWPVIPRADAASRKVHAKKLEKGVWHRVGNAVGNRPRPLWLASALGLLVLAAFATQIKADGVAQSDLILGYSEARAGQEALGDHFPSGSGSPAQIVIKQDLMDEAIETILATDGVASVQPYGAGFMGGEPKVSDGEVLLQAVLDDDPNSQAAKDTIASLRDNLAEADLLAAVGGPTAAQLDTTTASIHDRAIIIPTVLVAITIILAILLRAIVAPILLLATTVLSFAASIGVAALLFNNVWNFPGADPSVLLYGFVFLVALGIDYNIFLMTRVREESITIGTSRGVIKGLVVTGGVITSAGIVLAATFAALGVIPILFLFQLAFIVAFGVLLDTFIVRSILVPALIKDFGSIVWWPSKIKE